MNTAKTRHTLNQLRSAFEATAPLLVLTGAGISAGCGIPTYRDHRGTWLRSDPITHQAFTSDPRQRQRYWGRSAIGWPAVRNARPSVAHYALASLERAGMVHRVITQNVDRLHQRAGSRDTLDLHGRLDRVNCLDCGAHGKRDELQSRILAANPWLDRDPGEARPDGDASLAESEVHRVAVPACERCGGTLMPDVVFFGGSIPASRVHSARASLERAGGLLVIGSSLVVYSGFRFCRWAAALGKPIVLINPGESRADALATLRIPMAADTALGALLADLAIPAPEDQVNAIEETS